MHPHTQRKSTKRLGRLSPPGVAPARTRIAGAHAAIPEVDDEELSHMANDLAFFNAAHYREAEPGDVREEDIERAEAEITALFRRERLM